MNRRDVLKGAITGASAVGLQGQHVHQPPAPAQAKAAAPWKPLLFDAHQNETVIVLSELIIPRTDTPGARDAKVNEYIDLILNDGPPGPRRAFIEGLGWLDGFALRRHNKPFAGCTAEQQTALLQALEEAGSTRTGQTLNRAGTPDRAAEPDRAVNPPERPSGGPAAAPARAGDEPDLARGARFFRQVKMLTVQGYYTSKIGIDELNKGGRVPATFGCTHQGGSHA